jgi:hypothetical protein
MKTLFEELEDDARDCAREARDARAGEILQQARG